VILTFISEILQIAFYKVGKMFINLNTKLSFEVDRFSNGTFLRISIMKGYNRVNFIFLNPNNLHITIWHNINILSQVIKVLIR